MLSAASNRTAPGVPNLTVAILDDDPLVRRIITRFLQHDGIGVIPLEPTPAVAERLVRGEVAADLVLLDRNMGELDGYELWCRLRERNPALARRAALLTGGTAPTGAPAELVTLQKPIGRDTLLAWVMEASEKSADAG